MNALPSAKVRLVRLLLLLFAVLLVATLYPTPLLPGRLLLAGDGTTRTLASTRVGLTRLAAYWETPAVAQSTVRADIHEPLDVQLYLTAQVTFDLVLGFDNAANAYYFIFGQVFDPGIRINIGLLEDHAGAGGANTVDVRQRSLHALISGKINPCDSSHTSTLPLLVLGVHGANDVNLAVTPHDLALVTHRFYGSPYLHLDSYFR